MISKSKKIFTLLVVTILLSGLVVGCAGGDQGAKDGKKELKVVMSLGESEWKVIKQEILPPFEKKYNVEVTPFQIGSGNVIKKLQSLKAAGNMTIDVVAQDNMQLAPLVDRGLVEDLSEYRDIIPKEVIDALIKVGEFNGKLYFMPYRPNVEIAFYNQKKFEKYGLKPPENWDELLKVAKTFKKKEGIGRVIGIKGGLASDTTVHLFDYIRSAGGNPLVLNDEGSIKAFKFLKKLKPYLSPDFKRATWDTTNKFLATESVYLGRNWPFGVNIIVKKYNKDEIKAYHGWSGPVKESHVLGGSVLAIPKGAPHEELAVKFIKYLMSKKVQKQLVTKLAWPSSRTDAYGEVPKWQKPYFEAVKEAMKYAEPRPNVPYWATVSRALNSAFKEIVLNDAPVEETLDKYHQVIQNAKKEAQ
ncbi:ABC-type sugar transport system, periplasmic component [Halobacteroides halobius DSM 5150]|uniref:ABC-type sugar transport system, periplasmic component n=1 Tax=Halobacteroides halobius (strain ATCC 35273 / DSM 5150 / MD-1) TaxID=748449 RepID=L0KAU5_HALHC|nr:extracellular solute-binding protein [Halobacteroides halobius]AGB41494.1 ABC-type sugar transport system, periplasmic component [Halobacteroides halobius DSM 5150]